MLLRRDVALRGPGSTWTQIVTSSWMRSAAVRRPARGRRSSSTCPPSSSSSRAARTLVADARAARSPDAVTRRRSPRCAASAAWTRCRRSACAPRSATSSLSRPRSCGVPGDRPEPSTPPTPNAAWARSPRPDPTHARRLLVEAAWHYRRRPAIGHNARAPPARPGPARRSRSPGAPSGACTSAARR